MKAIAKAYERLPWLSILAIFLGSRLLILGGLLLAGQKTAVEWAISVFRFLFNSVSPIGTPFAVHPFTFYPGSHAFSDFAKFWDGLWYLDIALHGYTYDGTTQHQSITFYPFYPWLAKLFAAPLTFFGVQSELAVLLSGVILSNALFLAALVMLFILVREKSGARAAWINITLLALYPGSLFCSLFLTEGCYLALAIGFFLALERKRYLLAALLSWPACLTRFNGLGLALSYPAKTGFKTLFQKPWILILLMAGPLLYPLYLAWGFGDPLLYLKMHANYRGQLPILKLGGLILLTVSVWLLISKGSPLGRHSFFPKIRRFSMFAIAAGAGLFYLCSLLNLLELPGPWAATLNLLPVHLGPVATATAFALIIFALWGHRLEAAYQVYITLNLFPLLFSGTFFSNHRYMTLIFPLFWALALGLEKHPKGTLAVCGAFAGLLLGLAVLYSRFGWLMIF